MVVVVAVAIVISLAEEPRGFAYKLILWTGNNDGEHDTISTKRFITPCGVLFLCWHKFATKNGG